MPILQVGQWETWENFCNLSEFMSLVGGGAGISIQKHNSKIEVTVDRLYFL